MVSTEIFLKHVTVSHRGKECLQFHFKGLLTNKTAVEMCGEWQTIVSQNPYKKYCVVFHALEMDNYEPQARNTFQKTIKQLAPSIDKIWVVTNSKLIAGGAAIMSIFTSFPMECVASEEMVQF